MGNADGSTAFDIDLDCDHLASDQLAIVEQQVRSYDFYQLVELLQRLADEDPETEGWETHCRLLFKANPSLGFAASDISKLEMLEQGGFCLETTFFGLNGAQSPLPGFLLEEIASESETGLRRHFLDFFNNRLLALVYRIWRKYRYYIRFKENASDAFSSQLFALVGLADENLRGETAINWGKMLSYAGTLAGRSRSPQIVAGIISHCFDLDNVVIRQWVERKVDIPNHQRMCLGNANCELGESTIIGSTVRDCTGKFVIEIKDLTQSRFNDFLPSGKEYLPFCKLVEFILREQMAFDLELELKEDEVPSLQLIQGSTLSLGWSSFLGETNNNRKVCIQVRQ
ncbi:type VI secretion system baseplate subunit TssG [Photobacterium sp. GB-27]|uniref:type VI secretion system baseplate subunit TssG n=1 Tax=unclassified Photobacterium TaxID=2628852 RepID=UPI000D16C8DA|nr:MULTISPECIES: type VI secretion system baseplate subunit TssG [unclassified Photobacterium]PSV31885.1 type VI secretion system baseplate subunit TssG [Photobacterium sp. GB-27]PSV52123.1 type VI secretion system baseplate subunit TssG [Photobacterium sp. GB-3]